ncbi:23S rRNA (adenine(2030)-N(6))-methyltransferase RlmJ [Gracilinema caldarium]|uniref:23S rRNA (adenine(2030)-N(6))-methyltransferase RlmJ n=1 Tax=Gracilinema caldarium TaxID=215591 RepID=UPI0026E92A02|nr:23S rRNA (adenine(2030)-N(6))-methyltransferase RlmJ [Gracilinema caldarium]
MLGYRHAFHAGNHGDILKHFILFHSLEYLRQKDVPLLYVDTHAGAGSYQLESGYAAQNKEWLDGFQRLRQTLSPLPESLIQFRDFLESWIAHTGSYPGSPAIADHLLRETDRRIFFEMHPSDFLFLKEAFEHKKQVSVLNTDGFSGLKAFLPPPSRRACIFIDPSYELASDYEKLLEMIKDALRRFATGTYLIWYPLLSRPEAKELPEKLLSLYSGNRCSIEIQVTEAHERGMFGSGVVIFNPPWVLHRIIPEAIPILADILSVKRDKPEPNFRFQFF